MRPDLADLPRAGVDVLLADLIAAGRALSHDVAWLPAFDAKRV